MKQIEASVAANLRMAKSIWLDRLTRNLRDLLSALTNQFQFSVAHGDLLLLDGSWYVTHTGLLRLARRYRCSGIHAQPATEFCAPAGSRWAFKAMVFKSPRCKGFVGYGDADPSNVSPAMRGAEMRIAETRAVNRALRKAYGVGICSVEELGASTGTRSVRTERKGPSPAEPTKGTNGHHPLRDRLCLLIRQHRLDPALVKAYAADYCDVAELRQATREQVATFIKHLVEYVQNDREGLLCQLNSYGPKPASEALVTITNDSTIDESEKAAGAA